jgi:hypothetical protein
MNFRALFLILAPMSAQARPLITFPLSECKISHVGHKYEYGEIANTANIKDLGTSLPRPSEYCSKKATELYISDAQKILASEPLLQDKGYPVMPVRCGVFQGKFGYSFVVVESALSVIAEDYTNKSILQIYSLKHSSKERKQLYGAALDKTTDDNSNHVTAVCSNSTVILENRHKLGKDYRLLVLNPSDGSIDIQDVEGNWGD